MISDILKRAIADIDVDLQDSVLGAAYTGELKDRIVRLRNEMADIVSKRHLTEVESSKDFEYQSIYLVYGVNRYGETPDGGFLSIPDAIARNIPNHEIEGWEFHSMVNDQNGLFRRVKRG